MEYGHIILDTSGSKTGSGKVTGFSASAAEIMGIQPGKLENLDAPGLKSLMEDKFGVSVAACLEDKKATQTEAQTETGQRYNLRFSFGEHGECVVFFELMNSETEDDSFGYRQIVEQQNELICRYKPDTTLLYVNKAYADAFGKKPDELVGRKFIEFVPEEEHDGVINNIALINQSNPEKRYEHRVILRDGTTQWQEWEDQAIFDSDGNIKHIQGVGRDITRLKHIQNEVSIREKLLREVINHLPHYIFAKDWEGRFIFVNKAIAELYGTTEDEMIGKKPDEFWVPEDDMVAYRENDRKVMKTGHTQLRIETLEDKEKGLRYLQTTKVPFEHFASPKGAMLGISVDITDEVLAKKEIEAKNELQKLIMETAIKLINVPIDELDEAINRALMKVGIFSSVDRAYLFKYDYENKLIVNTHEWCAEGIQPEIENLQEVEIESIPEWVETHMRGDIVHIPDVSALPADNPVKQILEPQNVKTLITVPLMQEKRCQGFVGFDAVRAAKRWSDVDITLLSVLAELLANSNMRVEFEKRLIEARREAEDANQAKSQFLANMSHEIRTPLNGVMGMTQLLMNSELNEEQLRFAEIAYRSGKSLLNLINDILDLSKIEGRKLELKPVDMNFRNMMNDIVNMMFPVVEKKKLELEYFIDPDLPHLIRADQLRLEQILINLLNNAIKFTSDGQISVQVSYKTGDKPQIRVEVSDTGIGIPEDRLKDLFSPFTQLDTSTTKKFSGTGLGLAICKELVGLMDGVIDVESTEDKGSVFWFQVKVDEAQPEKSLVRPHDVNKDYRFLIAGKSETQQIIIHNLLKDRYDNVDQVSSSKEALRTVQKAIHNHSRYDFVIIDQNLADMSGLELSDVLLKKFGEDKPYIIYLARQGELPGELKMRKSGIDYSLSKPVHKTVLYGALQYVTRKSMFEQNVGEELHPADLVAERNTNGGIRVLLAEDNHVNQLLMKAILDKLEVRSMVVENGREAVEAIKYHDFDVVLMDCQMPEMDGFRASRIIRELENEKAKIPIIAVTAHALKGDRDKCINAGMDDYISKPYDLEKVGSVLYKWLKNGKTLNADAVESANRKNLTEGANESILNLETDGFSSQELLRKVGGDDALMSKLLERFIEEGGKLVRLTTEQFDAGNFDELRNSIHSLKGISANICVHNLHRICEAAESLIDDNKYKSLEPLLKKLTKAFDTFKSQLQQES